MVYMGNVDTFVRSIANSNGCEALAYALKCASAAAGTEFAFLALWTEKGIEVIASHGLPLGIGRSWPTPAATLETFSEALFVPDTSTASLLETDMLWFPLLWKSFASVPIRLSRDGSLLTLVTASSHSGAHDRTASLETLKGIAGLLKYQLRLMGEVFNPIVSPAPETVREPGIGYDCRSHGDALDPATRVSDQFLIDFLLKTLITKHRIHSRDAVSYHTLRTWRSGFKEHQLDALRTIKLLKADRFIETIASEMAHAVQSIVGQNTFQFVTNVPCGNSGPNCMAHAIAKKVSALLEVPHIRLFDDLKVQGSSHPRRNIDRPKMRMTGHATGNGLLVDDVATSGSHLTEACQLMRAAGNGAFPIAWIGSQ